MVIKIDTFDNIEYDIYIMRSEWEYVGKVEKNKIVTLEKNIKFRYKNINDYREIHCLLDNICITLNNDDETLIENNNSYPIHVLTNYGDIIVNEGTFYGTDSLKIYIYK